MHVRVDQSWQNVEAPGVDRIVRGAVPGDTECRNPAVAHADIRLLGTPGQNTCAMADQQIEMGWHGSIP